MVAYSCKKRPIQPPSSLRHKLWYRIRTIRHAYGRFDVSQYPVRPRFSDDFKAKYAILGEVEIGDKRVGLAGMQLLSCKV